MALSFSSVFSKKNLNLVVGLITLLIVLWLVMFAVPGLFVNLFDTFLGNLILVAFILLALIYDLNLGAGLAFIIIVLYRFSHMTARLRQGFIM